MNRFHLSAFCCLFLAGCVGLAPPLIRRDRPAISAAIGDSWKEQTLQTIVKLRYADSPPVLLDVSSVISSNSFESGESFGATLAPNGAVGVQGFRNFLDSLGYSAGISQKYTDRPTITYTPLQGEKFSRNLMRPIPPATLFSLVQAGYPVDGVLQFTVRAINGVYNHSSAGARAREADPEFYELLDAMRRLQRAETLGMRLERRGAEETGLIFFSDKMSEESRRDAKRVREILGIDSDANELLLTFGTVPRNGTELAILSRSMLEILLEVASDLEAPARDIAEGRTPPNQTMPANPSPRDPPLLRIRSSRLPCRDAFASFRYRGHWFWIDDRDFKSKIAFSFLLMLFSLAESGAAPQIPTVTVPVN